jgi:hypothetical protein
MFAFYSSLRQKNKLNNVRLPKHTPVRVNGRRASIISILPPEVVGSRTDAESSLIDSDNLSIKRKIINGLSDGQNAGLIQGNLRPMRGRPEYPWLLPGTMINR